MSNDLHFDSLARACYANSARWFPELHETKVGAAIHFVAGLTGELGEFFSAEPDDQPEELADCFMYLFDLMACYGFRVDLTEAEMSGVHRNPRDGEAMLREIGEIANFVKKDNRTGRIADVHFPLEMACHRLLIRLVRIADRLGVDIFKQVIRKTDIREKRWGNRDDPAPWDAALHDEEYGS